MEDRDDAPILLWLIGIPIPIIILLYLFHVIRRLSPTQSPDAEDRAARLCDTLGDHGERLDGDGHVVGIGVQQARRIGA